MSAVLAGQTVAVLGGSSGIGLETARQASALGAQVIITGRDPARLSAAATALGPVRAVPFDATDPVALRTFFTGLRAPVDHVLVAAGGPYYAPLAAIDHAGASSAFDEHLWLMIELSQLALSYLAPTGSLVFLSGTAARRPVVGLTVPAAISAALVAATANLAVELAPRRINLVAAGFVDTPLSASLLGNDLERRRQELRSELPIRRVVQASDVAALVLHLMINTAVTGATYDIDGGQHLL